MRVVLRELWMGGDGAEIAVCQPKFLIGRAIDCDLRLRAPWISRRHCQLVIADDRVTLDDLGSRNGTYVNGERIWDERVLHSGDCIRLAASIYEVAIEPDLAMACGTHEGSHARCPAGAC